MIRTSLLLFLFLIITSTESVIAQTGAIGYQMRYDDPDSINKLFLHFQPIYGEVAATNMSIGLGIEIDYFLDKKLDFGVHFRTPYGQGADLMRDAALKNKSNTNSNSPVSYQYLEFGGTYHWRDFDEEKPVKVFLYQKKYKGNALASKVITTTKVISKVRRIYGGRLGGMFYKTTFDLSRTLENQGNWLADSEGNAIDSSAVLFGNLSSTGLYVGASMSWFRNFSLDFEKTYEPGGDDLLVTTFIDVLIAPVVNVDDILYNGTLYSSSSVDLSKFGFRVGVEGRFNRPMSWAYGAELGYRPSVSKQGFFAVLKLSFPVLGTDMKSTKVESIELGK